MENAGVEVIELPQQENLLTNFQCRLIRDNRRMFPLPHFRPLHFPPYQFFHSRIFSRPLFFRPHVSKFLVVGGAARAISRKRYTGDHEVEPNRHTAGYHTVEPDRHTAGYHAFQDILHRIKLDRVDERISGDVEKL